MDVNVKFFIGNCFVDYICTWKAICTEGTSLQYDVRVGYICIIPNKIAMCVLKPIS